MILLFRIISDEDQGFFRDLVADGSDTFLELHHTLQKNLEYDPSQLASFFITSENWEKQKEITLIDMTQEGGPDTATMGEVTVGEWVTEVGQRMIYVFDFFSERAFFMELIEKSDQVSPKNTPFVANGEGDPPAQLVLDRLFEQDGTGYESDDPGFGFDDPGDDFDDPGDEFYDPLLDESGEPGGENGDSGRFDPWEPEDD